MFNVKLPINFFSPYRARSIVEFWRRWHMTLSRFLRDYLYIPLGGNRRGPARRYANLMVTMVFGGLWHGASWTFVAWGGLHGAFLVVNHLWRDSTRGATWLRIPAAQGISWLVTLTAVVVAWVFFRAQSLPQAIGFVATMFGWGVNDDVARVVTVERTALVAALMVWALVAPNTCEVLGYTFAGERVAKESTATTRWRFEPRYALAIGALLCATAAVGLFERPRLEFLYYRF
jgi:D-alanyl-lipoteichoic acid acyltransferase DltB (MBOAT superfamily)